MDQASKAAETDAAERSVAPPEVATDGDGAPAAPKPRRRRRGGRGRGGRSSSAGIRNGDAAPAGDDDAASPVEAGPAEARAEDSTGPSDRAVSADGSTATDGDGAPKPSSSSSRRRRRGGRGRGGGRSGASAAKVAANVAEGEVEEAPPEASPESQRDDAAPDADAAAASDAPRSRSSRSRSRSRRRTGGAGAKVAAEGAVGPAADAAEAAPEPARRRAASDAATMTVEEQVAAGGPTRGIRSGRARTGGDRRRRREPAAPPPRVTDKLMVITEHGDRDQIAVLEEDVLVQHYVTRQGATSMVGNVYLGRVQNVLPGMEAAFVDVGRGRNGVLYAGEVNYSPEDVEGPAPRIEQVLKSGQGVLVQVTKDPMGGKGARLTANLSLAGRYLVLAPDQDLSGISRRLSDDARKKLKAVLKKVKPPEHGVIVRTAAEGASEEAIAADLTRLLSVWDDITRRAKKSKAPAVLYEEPELTVRVVRDLFTDEEFRELVTDSPRIHGKVMDYVRDVAPDLAPKVTLHTGPLSAFEQHRVVEQIHKALDRKVWLPSGGYLIVERTEAMTIVDVNTGKAVGKTNLEETVVNTNLEAAREVARQLRLRDIGGIIVIDFIDMLLEKNKKQVEDTMRDALAIDKTRSQVFEIGPLGLMQVTRKRVSSGLVESFSETCPTCEGRGILLHYDVD